MSNNKEKGLEKNNKKTDSNIDKKQIFKMRLGDFFDQKQESDISFFDKEENSDFSEFIRYLDRNWNRVEFWDDFLSQSFCRIEFKKQFLNIYLTRKNLISAFENFLNKSFNLKEDQKEKIKKILKTKKNSFLKEINLSNFKREKFILDTLQIDDIEVLLKENKKDEKILLDIFWKVSLDILSNHDLMKSLRKVYTFSFVDLEDIKNILGMLNLDQKKYIICYFLPQISISDAIKYGILKEDEIKNVLKNTVLLKFKIENIDEEISNYYDSIFLDTSNLNFKNLIISDELLFKIVEEYNLTRRSINNNLGIPNFSSFLTKVKTSDDISRNIRDSIDFLQKWWYVKIEKKTKTKVDTYYFYVQNITDNFFDFVNITWKNWSVNKWNKWLSAPQTLVSFYNSLLAISKEDNLSINFYTNDDFKNLVKNQNIKEDIFDYEDIETIDDLKKFLDKIDPKWNQVDLQKMAFLAKPVDKNLESRQNLAIKDWDLFIVSKIVWNMVYIVWQPPISITDFANAFKQRECQRFKRIDSFKEMFEDLKATDNYKDSLKDFEVKDNKIVKKWTDIEITYFVWEKWECVNISKVLDNSLNFVEWIFKEEKGKKIFEWKRKWSWFDFNTFFIYLKNKKLKPYTKHIEEKSEDNIQEKSIKRKVNLFSAYMWMLSISEILAWLKHVKDVIEQKLQTWNRLKRAKFALSVWKFLPREVRDSLQSMVEWEEKKAMEDLLNDLTWSDSKVMIPRIKRILLNKSSPQYEIERAMFAMLSKYWVLYNKKEMQEFRWKFVWYEALWWKVGDDLYMKTKKECEEATLSKDWWSGTPQPVPFTEEYLIERLLSLQAQWKRSPKRRSQIHKEFWNYLIKWISSELENWANKVRDKLTLKWRLDYCMEQIKDGWYANALWALDKIWWIWWSPKDMHAIPFVITATWISTYFSEFILSKFLSKWRWTVYTEIMFNKNKGTLNIFKEALREIIKSFPWSEVMLLEYEKIWGDPEKAYNFWNKYWDKLVWRMTMKDWYIFAKKHKNEIFSKYYDFYSWCQNDNEYEIKKEDITIWLIDYQNTPVVYTMWKKIATSYIIFNQAWRISSTAWDFVFNSFLQHLEELQKIDYLDDDEKFELFFEIYSTLEPTIRARFWWWEWWVIMQKSPEVRRLKSYWIDLIGDDKFDDIESEWWKVSKDTVFSYIDKPSYKEHVKRAYEKFKNINLSSSNDDELKEWIEEVKTSIDDIINNYDYEKNK